MESFWNTGCPAQWDVQRAPGEAKSGSGNIEPTFSCSPDQLLEFSLLLCEGWRLTRSNRVKREIKSGAWSHRLIGRQVSCKPLQFTHSHVVGDWAQPLRRSHFFETYESSTLTPSWKHACTPKGLFTAGRTTKTVSSNKDVLCYVVLAIYPPQVNESPVEKIYIYFSYLGHFCRSFLRKPSHV